MDETDFFLPPEQCVDLTEESASRKLPARPAVAILADADGKAVQLVCWKNLRRTLATRLKPRPADAASRRVNWQDVVRSVRWRPVDGPFEADWVYLETARRIFPQTWRELVPWTETFFLHIDPDEEFPRYVRTSDLSRPAGQLIGPLRDKPSAARLIEVIEDAFELCRYHNILTQSPRGKACAYKDMGKCPAPCDGSISMQQYHRLIDLSLAGIADPAVLVAEHTHRMEQAAAELRFETAAKIKMLVDQLSRLTVGPLSRARPLTQFQFVTMQPGPRRGQAKLLLVLPGHIEPIASLLCPPGDCGDLIAAILARAREYRDSNGLPERIGLVARHLFGGAFIPLPDLRPTVLMAAYERLSRPAPPQADKTDIEFQHD